MERAVAVPSAQFVTASVRRGDLVISVDAPGVLVPDRTHVVSAGFEGIVKQVFVRVGSSVQPTDVVASLENLQMEAEARDRVADVTSLSAELQDAEVEGRASQLQREGALQVARSTERQAAEVLRSDSDLVSQGLIAANTYRIARIKAVEAQSLLQIAREQMVVGASQNRVRTTLAAAKLTRAREALTVARRNLDRLVVRAGQEGTIQDVLVDPGQRAAPDTIFAHIVRDDDLKAMLQVPEADMRSIRAGLRATLRIAGGPTVTGVVKRIDPSVKNGTVMVEVGLTRSVSGIHPQQNVDGSVRVARLHDVLYLSRPAGVLDRTRVSLYRFSPDGHTARRIPVVVGLGSIDTIEVRSGLSVGDHVVVSDTSSLGDAPLVRIQ